MSGYIYLNMEDFDFKQDLTQDEQEWLYRIVHPFYRGTRSMIVIHNFRLNGCPCTPIPVAIGYSDVKSGIGISFLDYGVWLEDPEKVKAREKAKENFMPDISLAEKSEKASKKKGEK